MFGLVGEKCLMMEIKVKYMVCILSQKLAKVREVIRLAELYLLTMSHYQP